MNRLNIFIVFISTFFTLNVLGESIVLQGVYQEQNLYFQNPENEDGFGYSIQLVRVNGQLYPGNINASAFEVDFSKIGLKKGAPIEVLVEYEGDVPPKPLNPFCIQPESTFQLENIEINKDGLLQFSTSNEQGPLPYIIQHYRWNKWISAGEVQGDGTPDVTEYQFKAILHSGENILRLAQRKQDGTYNISKTVKIDNPVDEIKMDYQKSQNKITFSAPTFYEIHNAYGILLKKGYSDDIDIKNLKQFNFLYISYDNKTESFKP